MQRKLFLISVAILLIVNISASCDGNQIDINSASQSELDKLTGIGSVKAQAIIDTRPFENLDELINVYGIGEKILEKIKEQNLACVNNKDKKDASGEEEKDVVEDKEVEKIENNSKEENPVEKVVVEEKNTEPEVISLNPALHDNIVLHDN